MTLTELREACAKVAEEGDDFPPVQKRIAKRIRAIPLPAPVDDEFDGHAPGPWSVESDDGGEVTVGTPTLVLATLHDPVEKSDALLMAAAPRLLRERNEARAARDAATVVAINDGQALLTLRSEVAGLTTALAAAQRERDEALALADAYLAGD